ncbi:Protein 21.1 [Giardia lamblia P15]|uniref:Protein 21.1 n=1 Tax=Giardia intestinalis (strain P15) TaxID=658858 RepID=E1F5L4_GIAIA|nr:Protein 21.1 [Giardia lamblia P15]
MESTDSSISSWFELVERQDTIAITHQLKKYAGQRNSEGLTALMFAARHNLHDSIKALLKAEATMTTAEGYTALMFAASLGNYVACELLLHAEGAIGLEDGRTALFLAASENHDTCIFLLAQYLGSTRDIYGRTALDYCVYADAFQAAEAYIKSVFVRNIYLPGSSYGDSMTRSTVKLERGGKHDPELESLHDPTVHRYTSLLLDELMQASKLASEQNKDEMCGFLRYVQEAVKTDHFFRFRGLYAEYTLQCLRKEQREITVKYCEQMAINETNIKLIDELKANLVSEKLHKEEVQIGVARSVQTHDLAPEYGSCKVAPSTYSPTANESVLHRKISEQEATIQSLRRAMNTLSAEKLSLLSSTGRTASELEKENELLLSSIQSDKVRSQSCNISFKSRMKRHSDEQPGTIQTNRSSIDQKKAPIDTTDSHSHLQYTPSPPEPSVTRRSTGSQLNFLSSDVSPPSPGVRIVPISPSSSGMPSSGINQGVIPRPQLACSPPSPPSPTIQQANIPVYAPLHTETDIDKCLAQFVPNISVPKNEAYYRNLVAVDRNTYSRLMRAVEQGNKTLIVSTLGESVQTSQLGVSAMMLAVKMRSIEVVRILKLKSLRIAMRCGYTALMECCKNGYSEMICHLISEAGMQTGDDFQWGAGCTALMIACYYGHSDCVRQLLDIEGKIYTPSGIRPRDFCSSPELLDIIGERTLGGPCLSQLEPLFPLF